MQACSIIASIDIQILIARLHGVISFSCTRKLHCLWSLGLLRNFNIGATGLTCHMGSECADFFCATFLAKQLHPTWPYTPWISKTRLTCKRNPKAIHGNQIRIWYLWCICPKFCSAHSSLPNPFSLQICLVFFGWVSSRVFRLGHIRVSFKSCFVSSAQACSHFGSSPYVPFRCDPTSIASDKI